MGNLRAKHSPTASLSLVRLFVPFMKIAEIVFASAWTSLSSLLVQIEKMKQLSVRHSYNDALLQHSRKQLSLLLGANL